MMKLSLLAVIHDLQWVVLIGGEPLKTTCELKFI